MPGMGKEATAALPKHCYQGPRRTGPGEQLGQPLLPSQTQHRSDPPCRLRPPFPMPRTVLLPSQTCPDPSSILAGNPNTLRAWHCSVPLGQHGGGGRTCPEPLAQHLQTLSVPPAKLLHAGPHHRCPQCNSLDFTPIQSVSGQTPASPTAMPLRPCPDPRFSIGPKLPGATLQVTRKTTL